MLRFVFGMVATLASFNVSAQVVRYEKEKVRKILLDYAAKDVTTEYRIVNPTQDPKKKEFIRYYIEVVAPEYEKLGRVVRQFWPYRLLTQSASFNSEEEKAEWSRKYQEGMAAYNSFMTDEKHTEILKTWAEKAEGLKGELADYARRSFGDRQRETFAPELKPLLDEVEKLEAEYEDTLTEVPAAAGLGKFNSGRTEIQRKFKKGELSFAEAQEQLNALAREVGFHMLGYEAVQAKGENLNKIALLRTQLAKAKGFPTWAAYMLEMNGQGYTPEYRGPANQRAFLHAYIRGSRVLREAFIKKRVKELGLNDEQVASLRANHMSLLTLPSLAQLQAYFPNNKITDVWEEVLIESGFKPETLQQIIVDDLPRAGKNASMAYMAGLSAPYTDYSVIDEDNLATIDAPKGSPDYKPGLTYILQNYNGAGPDDVEVAFHEGGHALEKLLKYKTEPTDESYGYVEVPSMTSERFMTDPLVIWHKAAPVDGVRPSKDEIQTLINNHEQNQINVLLGMATTALFDLDLWDYDYTAEGAQTFIERVEKLGQEVRERAGDLPYADTPIPYWYHWVSTTHYTSGSVRNIGYTYAEIASRMMAKYFYDEIEKLSGRRTWYRQPLLAKVMTEHLFEVGWKKPFPENIESITGRKFDPEAVLAEMGERLGVEPTSNCEKNLK